MSFELFIGHKSFMYIFTQNGLNSRPWRKLELLADYDIELACHPSMAIVVADALNKRLVLCGAKLAAIGIRYEDQEEDVAHRQFSGSDS